jgi:hypothetical protein
MNRIVALIALPLLIAILDGCEPATDPCHEFAPPPGHKASDCAVKPAIAAEQPKPTRYCYSSLAQADCYDEPQPGRTGGFLGSAAIPLSTPAEPPPSK